MTYISYELLSELVISLRGLPGACCLRPLPLHVRYSPLLQTTVHCNHEGRVETLRSRSAIELLLLNHQSEVQ